MKLGSNLLKDAAHTSCSNAKLYNNQVNARALIGQSAMVYCAKTPMEKYKSNRSQVSMVYKLSYTLLFFIFAGLKFRDNFLGTFYDIVFAGNLISRD